MDFQLWHGCCLEEMKKIEDNSIDMVLTDPPYRVISGGNKSKLSKAWANSNFKKNDGKIFKHNNIKFKEWVGGIYRVLKKEGHFYTMTNNLNLESHLTEARLAGFKFHGLLIWEKNIASPNRWYLKNCEYILFLRKGKAKPINNKSTKQILKYDVVRSKNHPTEKPVKLMEALIKNSSNKNDTVLDLFMGAGSTGVACKNLGRKFIGIEKDDKYFKIAQERILHN